MDTTDVLVSTIQRNESPPESHEALPSLYEVILVDQIDAMLKPAFRQFLDATTELLPGYMFEWRHHMQVHWEELYDVLFLVIQYRFICTHGATIAERLYGLQRRSIYGAESFCLDKYGKPLLKASKGMSWWQKEVSIFLVAISPRIVSVLMRMSALIRERRRARRQIEDVQRSFEARSRVIGAATLQTRAHQLLFQTPSYQVDEGPLTSFARAMSTMTYNSLTWLGEGTANALPYVVTGCGVLMSAQRLRYLFGHTPYHHPLLELAKTLLVRRSPELHRLSGTDSTRQTRTSDMAGNNSRPDWRLLTLICTVVALRITHWIMRQDESNNASIGTASFVSQVSSRAAGMPMEDIPLPPPPPGVGRGCVVPPSDADGGERCPLCAKAPRVSECGSTGGYLFCRECLLECILKDRNNNLAPSCPVTGVPCEEKDIIMIH